MASTRTPRTRRSKADELNDAIADLPTPDLEDLDPLGDAAKAEAPTIARDALAASEPNVQDEGRGRWDIRRITGNAPIAPLGILFGLNAVDELDRTAFSVLLPEVKKAFGLDLKGVLALTSA